MTRAIYNENATVPAQWLENLCAKNLIAPGVVDRRSITALVPTDVQDATQFHAFAGIGGWSYALRLAGWPDNEPVWTGSCPCQPFSNAGARKGAVDARHLWPAWYTLIRKCRPTTIFGEQVASYDGRLWLDAVSADLEDAGYAIGAADLAAAGVGAPHIRQRLYFVATRRMGHANSNTTREHPRDNAEGETGNAQRCPESDHGLERTGASRATGFWENVTWVPCQDGRARPVEPGTFTLAHGLPNHLELLRAYGSAIVPQVAAAFIRAFLDSTRVESVVPIGETPK